MKNVNMLQAVILDNGKGSRKLEIKINHVPSTLGGCEIQIFAEIVEREYQFSRIIS